MAKGTRATQIVRVPIRPCATVVSIRVPPRATAPATGPEIVQAIARATVLETGQEIARATGAAPAEGIAAASGVEGRARQLAT